MPDVIPDSGRMREFESGFHRDAADDKPRYSLIPRVALRRVALHYTRGADKYGGNNWRRACTDEELLVFMDCAFHHLQDWIAGDRKEDHAAAAVWNVLNGMDLEERLLPDRLDWSPIAERETPPRASTT